MLKRYIAVICGFFLYSVSSYSQYCAVSITDPGYDYGTTNVTLIGSVGFINQSSTPIGGGVCSNTGIPIGVEDYSTVDHTTLNIGNTYTVYASVGDPCGEVNDVEVYIDWNGDGDFLDGSEYLGVMTDLTNNPATDPADHINNGPTGNIVFAVPVTASAGITARMRVASSNYDDEPTIGACGSRSYGETEDYSIVIGGGGPMTYTTSTTTQNTSPAYQGDQNDQIIGIEVVTFGSTSPLTITSFTFTAGVTNPTTLADIKNAKLFHTPTSTFTVTGSNLLSSIPGTVTPTFTMTANTYTLSPGTNYFWLTFDVNTTATIGNTIDATCNLISVSGSSYAPTITDPIGTRTISPNMSITSCTTTQNTTSAVGAGSTNNNILGVQVLTSGAGNPLTAGTFTFTAAGTDAFADLGTTVKMYYTGTVSTFSTGTFFGSTTIGGLGTFTVAGTSTLSAGTNYFWLTYDINILATLGHKVDATCEMVNAGGANYIPVPITDGYRVIDLTTYVVTNTLTAGAGSLTAAINLANGDGTGSKITFNIPGSPPFKIPMGGSSLPDITAPVIIDGTTQPALSTFSCTPIVTIIGGVGNGLNVLAGNCIIKSLYMRGFNCGIRLTTNGGNIIQGCSLTNNQQGLYIESGSNGNIIGGNLNDCTERNIMSLNNISGIYITGSDNNVIKGNYVGVPSPDSIIVYFNYMNFVQGIYVTGSVGTIIGGTNVNDGNLIAGNYNNSGFFIVKGIFLQNGANNSTIKGNSILQNNMGIQIVNCSNIVIGGITAVETNIIGSSNGDIVINSTSNTTVKGNHCYGAVVAQAGTNNLVIGGAAPGEGNSIYSLQINSNATKIKGNDITSLNYSSPAGGDTIGGIEPGARNVIGEMDIASHNVVVAGNYVGTDVTGTSIVDDYGIGINGSNNKIGGNTAAQRNIISNINIQAGTGNIIQGNYLNVDVSGTTSLEGNPGNNVLLAVGSNNNIIGGSGPGEGNVISGGAANGAFNNGISIGGNFNVIKGNYIGTDATGTTVLPNVNGIVVTSDLNTIGGSSAGDGNIISGNIDKGIKMQRGNQNVIQGNYIGTDISGTNPLGNGDGVWLEGYSTSTLNKIGGYHLSEGNIIANNGRNGVFIGDLTMSGNNITQNLVSHNLIYNNGCTPYEAIKIDSIAGFEGNQNHAAPTITTVEVDKVNGLATPLDTVEIYRSVASDSCCRNARVFMGQTVADGGGNWSLAGLTVTTGYQIKALARDNNDNTSGFSACKKLIPINSYIFNNSMCKGDSMVLHAMGTAIVSYIWTPSAGLSNITASDPLTTTKTSTSYTAVAASNDSTILTVINLTVNPLPTLTSIGSSSLCLGATIPLTVAGAVNYRWIPSQGLSATSGSSVNANPASSSVYSIFGANINGCMDTAYISVDVHQLPTLITSNSVTICYLDSTTMNVSGAATYSWLPISGLSSSAAGTVKTSPPSTTNYTVTGSYSNGCSSNANISVTIVPPITVTAGPDASICGGSSVMLFGASNGSFSWKSSPHLSNLGIPNPIANPPVTETFEANAGNQCGFVSDSVTVTVWPSPAVDAGAASEIEYGDTIQLTAAAAGVNYLWTPPTGLNCDTCQTPKASPHHTTLYQIMVTDANGCSSTDTVTISIQFPDPYKCMYVPNAFSPNGDNENDILYVYIKCVQSIKFSVWDRMGIKMFETNDASIGWNGVYNNDPQHDQVFMYVLDAILLDNTVYQRKGNVTLVR